MLHTLIKHDLKALQAFVAIVECQGVSAAQARLNMSQSAISTHLAHLEESLGVTLCQRGRAGFALTKAGYQLYDACSQLLQATTEFHRNLRNIKWQRSVLSGTLRVCLVDHLPNHFTQAMIQLINSGYSRYPELHFEVDVRSPQEIETAVATSQMDVGIGYFAHPLNNLRYQPLFDERQNVYCHRDHPAAEVEELSVEMLENEYAWVRRGYLQDTSLCRLKPVQTTATAYQMEAVHLFILAGTHIGYLPQDYAAPWVNDGLLRVLLPQQTAYLVTHQAVTRPNSDPRVNWLLGQLVGLLGWHGHE